MYSNVLYFDNINSCGGTESVFYYLAKKYNKYDITIIYKTADDKQLKRLRKYVRCIPFNNQKIKCKKIFFNYAIDILDYVEADEYCQIIHTDYKALHRHPNIHSKITRYIGVSKTVCDSFKDLTGIDCELCYNPLSIDEPEKVLMLVSATRLTPEKGKNRIIELSKCFDECNIPYIWFIFTDDSLPIANPNVIYMRPRLDIMNYIAKADYVVQLSDDVEGFGLTPAEALSIGTPVIVTDCRAFKEIGVNESNGFILDLDMKNVPVEEIYKKAGTFDFKYESPKDSWDKILDKSPNIYFEEFNWKADCICVRPNGYNDLEINKFIKYNEELLDIPYHRALYLQDEKGFVKITKIKKGI